MLCPSFSPASLFIYVAVTAKTFFAGRSDQSFFAAYKKTAAFTAAVVVERMTGIEPALPAWEAGVLPLNYIRTSSCSNDDENHLITEKRKKQAFVP